METKKKLLIIVLIAMIILFLLFCGGALFVTLADGGMMDGNCGTNGSGMIRNVWMSGISWMWMPSLLFLALSILLAWVIFPKKKQ